MSIGERHAELDESELLRRILRLDDPAAARRFLAESLLDLMWIAPDTAGGKGAGEGAARALRLLVILPEVADTYPTSALFLSKATRWAEELGIPVANRGEMAAILRTRQRLH